MAFEFCCVVHFICYLRQLLCMYFFFSQCSVSVCCELHPCVVYLPIASSPKCADAQKGPKKSMSTLSLSLNEPQTSLFIHHVNIRFTYISQRYLDWIYFSFLCFFPVFVVLFCDGVCLWPCLFLFSSLFLLLIVFYFVSLLVLCDTFSIFHDHSILC